LHLTHNTPRSSQPENKGKLPAPRFDDVIWERGTCLVSSSLSVSGQEKTASAMATFTGAEDFVIGLIGMGDMGKMYARRLSSAGWR
jgi:hypothetical protein